MQAWQVESCNLLMKPQIRQITQIINHEWRRMNTNWEQSTEYTEETEASQTSAIVLGSLLTICDFDQGGIGRASVCSAVRHASRKRKSCHANALNARDFSTNGHDFLVRIHGRNRSLADVGHRSVEFVDNM